MWKIFDVVPGAVWAGLLAVAVLLAGVNYVRMSSAKQELANFKAEVAENTRKAEAEARTREQAMRRQVERIAENEAAKTQKLAARIATADLVARSLRDDIEKLNASPTPGNPEAAAFAQQARTARELLGACSTEYRSVAEEVDRRGIQIAGLQDYAQNVCQSPPK